MVIAVISLIYFIDYKKSNHTLSSDSICMDKTKDPIKTKNWNLPQYLEHYTDRKEITQAIWDKFDDPKPQRKTAILAGLYGLGGVGKTTLAKNAIHNPQQQYAFKGWFSAETKELLKADYFQLGEKYYLFTKNMSDQQKIIRVKDWLEQQGKILWPRAYRNSL